MHVKIDGSEHTGNYRCECECGVSWHGQAEKSNAVEFSPALPVAEVVAHMRLDHGGGSPDTEFSRRFRDWLARYWERANLRLARLGKAGGLVAQERMI